MKLIGHSIIASFILALLAAIVEFMFLERLTEFIDFVIAYFGYFTPTVIVYLLLHRFKGKPEYAVNEFLYPIILSMLFSAIITFPVAGVRILLEADATYFASFIDMFASGMIFIFIYIQFFPEMNSKKSE